MIGSMLDLDHPRREAIARLVAASLARRGVDVATQGIEVIEVEALLAGRPGLLDIVARVHDRLWHLVLGLHPAGTEVHMLRGSDDAVLGGFEDENGPAVAVDALWDADLAPLVALAIVGEEPSLVSISSDERAVVLDIDDRIGLSVFSWLTDHPHPGVDMLVSLDDAGFNHLAAPVALWRRHGRDLGVAQDLLTESADGWALALSSLRDLYGAGVAPEQAGGDFADEARSLGRMTARMHLASDRAFGRHNGAIADWAAEVEFVVRRLAPGLLGVPGPAESLRTLRANSAHYPMLRTHGDLHLGRTSRTNQGWVIADWLPGGVDVNGTPLFRSPLADVADLLWSLHFVAVSALDERHPSLRPRLEPLALAWEERNHAAFLVGYLSTPGIDELVPADRDLVDELTSVFELEQSAVRREQLPVA
ncbi:MAG: hypothetical protein ACRDVW_08810 [Acidimicrobiales bacterium]